MHCWPEGAGLCHVAWNSHRLYGWGSTGLSLHADHSTQCENQQHMCDSMETLTWVEAEAHSICLSIQERRPTIAYFENNYSLHLNLYFTGICVTLRQSMNKENKKKKKKEQKMNWYNYNAISAFLFSFGEALSTLTTHHWCVTVCVIKVAGESFMYYCFCINMKCKTCNTEWLYDWEVLFFLSFFLSFAQAQNSTI